jgi:NitT/TauT family transport system permease protein
MADTTASPASRPIADEAPKGFTLSTKTIERIFPWAVIIGLFAFWELSVWAFDFPQFILPAPSVIFEAMWKWRVPILDNAAQTAMTTVVGFGIAIVFGMVTGILVGSSSLIYNGFYPVLIAFNSIPKVAVVPILVIWFGIGTVPAIITAFLISFFPILVNVATGIATVEPELKDVLRALGASRRDIIVKVGIPRSLPYFFASLKIAITVAFVGSIIAETVASNKGIGHLMIVASSRFEVPLVFAGLMVTAIMGVVMYAIAVTIEKRMTGWSTRSMDGMTAN